MGQKQDLSALTDPPPLTSISGPTSSVTVHSSSSVSDDHIFLLDGDFGDFAEENPSLTLIGKVLGSRPYRHQAVFEALPAAWNFSYGGEIVPFDKDLFLFRFLHALDLFNVLKDFPWTVARNLLSLDHWSPNQDWSFSSFQILVQFHDLPLEALHRSVASRLVSKVGQPSQITLIEGLFQGQRIQFLRARVTLEVVVPLRSFLTIQIHSE
ncbi:hypothetical protein NE237_004467 [Protea cynaroides]|uniref:DUF4283 domain-containing protein n=1 Tax=Protea cynaroides TaxID=273540 RepID=A0A9Q0QTJ7_9MAGN|nr:hypothetical protein NE237_004467 [Protea cynaroides]